MDSLPHLPEFPVPPRRTIVEIQVWRLRGSASPTEIFRKTAGDDSLPSRVCDAWHRNRLWLDYDPREFVHRNGARKSIGRALRGTIEPLTARARRAGAGS